MPFSDINKNTPPNLTLDHQTNSLPIIKMSSFHYPLLIILTTLISTTNAQKPITLPIQKDPKTTQFYTTIQMGSNRAAITAVIDLGAPFLWFSCNDYVSKTYAPIPCGSAKCQVAEGIGCVGCNLPERPGCTNDTCGASPYNPYLDVIVSQGFAEDTLFYANRRVPEFLFSCMDKDYLEGLASGTTGMLGLARSNISFPTQVAAKLDLPHILTLCLPSGSSKGMLYVGSGLGPDIKKYLKSTPLIINPVSTYSIYVDGDASDEYFIGVKGISVDGKPLSVKKSYFAIDRNGVGGTKISTIRNFTSLHNSIYKPFTRAFVKAASDMKIKSVAGVGQFRACFSSKSISRGPTGPIVPDVDLVLPGENVYWRIKGGNSMVEIDREITCLGFVDGGSSPRTSVVIGAHQLEENLLEFDLAKSRLRFSSSLLALNKRCSSI